jgi:Ribbon-helix-helix protein, copG family.
VSDGYLQTSVYLTADDRQMLDELQRRTGDSRSQVVRDAVKKVYLEEDDSPSRRTRLIEIAEEIRRLA